MISTVASVSPLGSYVARNKKVINWGYPQLPMYPHLEVMYIYDYPRYTQTSSITIDSTKEGEEAYPVLVK